MPQTVPKSPMYGLTEATLAKNGKWDSALLAQAGKLLEAGTKQGLSPFGIAAVALSVEVIEVNTRPKPTFKCVKQFTCST